MSVATEIARIQQDKAKIRTKLVDLGLASSIDRLDELAAAVAGIENNGTVQATVQEGDTYTIPQGYHNGTGTVSGVAGGGNYTLQSKEITPTKAQQSVTADQGYYGLSGVTVEAIPENYQDVSAVTAEAADVLASKMFVAKDGSTTAGTMKNNGTITQEIDGMSDTNSVDIPEGYTAGGTVTLTDSIENALKGI